VAGALRESFWPFVALVTLAKGGRYIVLAAMTVPWL
jgi:membrane protein YqaA with SNARE-associated domain